MRNFHVMTNADKDQDLLVTKRIRDYLVKNGCRCDYEIVDRIPSERSLHLPKDTECVIVSGGDGTMIRVADLVAGSVPIIGVNLGRLGFLEEIEVDRLEEMLARLIADDFEIEERMMLTGTGSRLQEEKLHALNDIVISGGGSMQILTLKIYVNDLLLATYSADGMIVCTPTGSTAYNLSAGGPVVEPDAQSILMTPICPHNLNSRSIVLSADDEITIRVGESRYEGEQPAEASFDGCRKVELLPLDAITIRRSRISTSLIKLNRESFLKTLSAKFTGYMA